MGWEAILRVVHCVEARMMAFGCGNRTFGFALCGLRCGLKT